MQAAGEWVGYGSELEPPSDQSSGGPSGRRISPLPSYPRRIRRGPSPTRIWRPREWYSNQACSRPSSAQPWQGHRWPSVVITPQPSPGSTAWPPGVRPQSPSDCSEERRCDSEPIELPHQRCSTSPASTMSLQTSPPGACLTSTSRHRRAKTHPSSLVRPPSSPILPPHTPSHSTCPGPMSSHLSTSGRT
jgi:hypothetical protein